MMWKNVSAVAMAAALVVITGCSNDGPNGRFDPRTLGDADRAASQDYIRDPLKPLPTTLRSQFMPDQRGKPDAPKEPPVKMPLAPDSQIIHLSLREVTQRAVANNLNVRVSGYNPAIDETRVPEAEARFDPEAFVNTTFVANRQPVQAVTGTNYDALQLQAGLRQLLPSGGQVELSISPTRYNFADPTLGENPITHASANNTLWSTQIQAQLTQPLLQNFGNGVNQARIVINRLNERITLLDFRKDLEEMLKNTEEAYWRLAQAQQNQIILERLLQRTIDTADIVSKRFGQDVTLEQISNSVSRVESTRSDLIRARQRVKDLSDQLKGFMNDPEFPTASNLLILTADAPLQELVTFDFNDTMSTALVNRYDIGQQQLRVDSAGVALDVAKNNQLPQLNFVGSVGEGGNAQDFGTSLDQTFQGQSRLNWSAGLQFTQKLGNREANAIYRRSQLQRQQAIIQYQATIETATLEVKTAQREVETSWQAMGQTRSARFAAAKALEVVETLERGGEALRPDFIERKLQRQQDLAQAEQAETDAVASYNIAIADLEKKKGTLLRYNNIVLDKKMFKH